MSGDGDDIESYRKAERVIREIIKPDQMKASADFFDGAQSLFVKDGLAVEVEYSNWFGVEVKVDERSNEQEINKVKEWTELMLKGV